MTKTGRVVSWMLVLAGVQIGGLAAQTILVAPPPQQKDASSRGRIAGFEARFRQQILIVGSTLGDAVGKDLTGVWFRRDHALGLSFQPGAADLEVRLSYAQVTANAPSPAFAINRGPSPVTVFDQVLPLPASTPVPEHAAVPWSAPHAVLIPFNPPFAYAGGDLCIEIDGAPIPSSVPGALWSVDYLHQAPTGNVSHLGQPCGVAAADFEWTAGAWARHAVPGSTLRLTSFGLPQTAGLLWLGLPLAQPVSLAPIGAPGCDLHVQPLVEVVGAYRTPFGGRRFSSLSQDVHLPAGPAFLGATFAVQWINLEGAPVSNAAGVTTTNGLAITLASSPSGGALATVISEDVPDGVPLPAVGRVEIGRGPVMRFDFR